MRAATRSSTAATTGLDSRTALAQDGQERNRLGKAAARSHQIGAALVPAGIQAPRMSLRALNPTAAARAFVRGEHSQRTQPSQPLGELARREFPLVAVPEAPAHAPHRSRWHSRKLLRPPNLSRTAFSSRGSAGCPCGRCTSRTLPLNLEHRTSDGLVLRPLNRLRRRQSSRSSADSLSIVSAFSLLSCHPGSLGSQSRCARR